MNPYSGFLQQSMWALLSGLTPETPAKWGVMNAQQMVEHLCTLFLISAGEIQAQPLFDEQRTRKSYQYIIALQKPFPRNIAINRELVEKAEAPKYASLQAAIAGLQAAVSAFFASFEADYEQKRPHPAFGDLDYMEWLYFHYTHVSHHFVQFGLLEDAKPA